VASRGSADYYYYYYYYYYFDWYRSRSVTLNDLERRSGRYFALIYRPYWTRAIYAAAEFLLLLSPEEIDAHLLAAPLISGSFVWYGLTVQNAPIKDKPQAIYVYNVMNTL